jgi:hypothetical protein
MTTALLIVSRITATSSKQAMTVGESNTEINAITPFWVGQYSTPIVGQFSMPIYTLGHFATPMKFLRPTGSLTVLRGFDGRELLAFWRRLRPNERYEESTISFYPICCNDLPASGRAP